MGAMSYGYYLADDDTELGDGEGLREIWRELGLTDKCRFNGVSRLSDGTLRFVMRDIFAWELAKDGRVVSRFRIAVFDRSPL